jgi:hypothetical protein
LMRRDFEVVAAALLDHGPELFSVVRPRIFLGSDERAVAASALQQSFTTPWKRLRATLAKLSEPRRMVRAPNIPVLQWRVMLPKALDCLTVRRCCWVILAIAEVVDAREFL